MVTSGRDPSVPVMRMNMPYGRASCQRSASLPHSTSQDGQFQMSDVCARNSALA